MVALTRNERVLREVLGLNYHERGSVSMAELLRRTIPADVRQGMSANQRAAELWRTANGDVERVHTTGVYLRKPPCKGLPPVLGVYVDSHARLSDFNANKEIYLTRLAEVGLEVSGIEFRLTRWPAPQGGDGLNGGTGSHRGDDLRRHGSRAAACELPPLSPAEERRVRDACAGLPDGLKQRVERAMAISLRREHSRGLRTADADVNGGSA